MSRLASLDLTVVMTKTTKNQNENQNENENRHEQDMGADHADAGGTTLVIGGTGKTGRKVAERLTAQGRLVRVGSRRGEPPFDWNDPGTWLPALEDVDRVYVTY